MTGRVFIDTNILVYAYVRADIKKHKKANEFLNNLSGKEVYISVQILNEICSALKKNSVDDEKIRYYINYCIEKYNVCALTINEVKLCLDIKDRYKYSHWDCLVISSAKAAGCSILYSEDMQSKQIIYSNLKIINPLADN